MNEATIREVNISANDRFPPPIVRMRSMAAPMAMEADAPIPVEAGNSTVTVTVQGSGSVELKARGDRARPQKARAVAGIRRSRRGDCPG